MPLTRPPLHLSALLLAGLAASPAAAQTRDIMRSMHPEMAAPATPEKAAQPGEATQSEKASQSEKAKDGAASPEAARPADAK